MTVYGCCGVGIVMGHYLGGDTAAALWLLGPSGALSAGWLVSFAALPAPALLAALLSRTRPAAAAAAVLAVVSVGGVGHDAVAVAVGETVILLHPPLPSVGVSIGMEMGCQYNDSLARRLGGGRRGRAGSAHSVHLCWGAVAGVAVRTCRDPDRNPMWRQLPGAGLVGQLRALRAGVVQDSNSGYQMLLPPAYRCPVFASRATHRRVVQLAGPLDMRTVGSTGTPPPWARARWSGTAANQRAGPDSAGPASLPSCTPAIGTGR